MKREHRSDCAVHNEPAYPKGLCDCDCGLKPFCCHISCDKDAEYTIIYGGSPDDITESCRDHIPEVMTDAPRHEIIRLSQGGSSKP